MHVAAPALPERYDLATMLRPLAVTGSPGKSAGLASTNMKLRDFQQVCPNSLAAFRKLRRLRTAFGSAAALGALALLFHFVAGEHADGLGNALCNTCT